MIQNIEIPIRNELKEQKLVKSMFNESKVIVIKDAKYHDKLMAIILGGDLRKSVIWQRHYAMKIFHY